MEHASRFVQYDLWGYPVREPQSTPSLIHAAFDNVDVRIVMVKGEPWWVLADVAKVLAYKLASDAARILRDKEKGMHQTHTPGGTQNVVIISEPGLYRLIMRSNKPEAERFQDWVCEEVLPTIRRTGTYSVRSPRINKEIRRLKIDSETAKARCDQFAVNKSQNRKLADDGFKPSDFAAYHNAIYRGQFGQEASGLREKLGLRSGQTPLDRMGLLPLMANGHIKAVIAARVQSLGGNLPVEAHLAMAEQTAKEMADADQKKLGSGYHIDLADDPRRGKTIDVVPSKLIAVG